MQSSFGFDHRHDILLGIIVGEFSDADLHRLLDELKRHAKTLRPVAVITDLSEAAVTLSTDGVWSAAQLSSPFAEETIRFLVAPDDHAFGLGRMYQMMGGESRENLTVVRSSDEALAALDVRDPLFEPVELNPKERSSGAMHQPSL